MKMQLNKDEISKAVEYYLRSFYSYTCNLSDIEFQVDAKHGEVEASMEVTKIEE